MKKISILRAKRLLFQNKEKKCEICNSKKSIEVHHKDGNSLNNNQRNLMILCRPCHCKAHREMATNKRTRIIIEIDNDLHSLFKSKVNKLGTTMHYTAIQLIKKYIGGKK